MDTERANGRERKFARLASSREDILDGEVRDIVGSVAMCQRPNMWFEPYYPPYKTYRRLAGNHPAFSLHEERTY